LTGCSVGTAPLPDELRIPHPTRLPPSTPGYDAIIAAHENAMVKGEPGYLDPVTGLFVMTAAYLWERGECCDSGCRHCPYLPRS
jgi:Family of unknown function (DUF5522)